MVTYQKYARVFGWYILMGTIQSCITLHEIDSLETLKYYWVILAAYTVKSSICSVPDKAKLESAKPPVRIATTSQGGNPKSKDVRIMQVAGDKNEIVWQIFRTCMYKSKASTAENLNRKTRFKLQFISIFILCSLCACACVCVQANAWHFRLFHELSIGATRKRMMSNNQGYCF